MEIVIRGHNLPGKTFRNAGVPIHNCLLYTSDAADE